MKNLNVKLLSERERVRYYRLLSTSPRDRTDSDNEELAELVMRMQQAAARINGREAKKFTREH